MLVAVLFAVVIGLALGMLGGGGSILTVPLLVYGVGLEEKAAIATSLLVVGVTSAAAAVASARGGTVAWRIGLVFAAGGMAGAFVGGRLAAYVPGPLLLLLFAVVTGVTALGMWRGRRLAPPAVEAPLPIVAIVLEGAAVGVVTGLVGAGGGFLIVPALVLWARLPMHVAVGTSLVVIALKSLAGFAGYASHVDVDYRLVALVSIAAVAGSLAGSSLRPCVRAETLRRSFALLAGGMAVFIFTHVLV